MIQTTELESEGVCHSLFLHRVPKLATPLASNAQLSLRFIDFKEISYTALTILTLLTVIPIRPMTYTSYHVCRAGTTKKNIPACRLLCTRSHFNRSLTVSVGISVLRVIGLHFVNSGIKINGKYYRETLLKE